MGKKLFIAEKPSVAQEFAKVLPENMSRRDGYLESDRFVVTWCVGHLVTMSYPEVYDQSLKRWTFDTLPFIPQEFRYEVIPAVAKQFGIVKGLLNREDVDCIYVCTDSGREGEYIYRLVDSMAGVPAAKEKRRVWIDSQTEEEIKRGIREAKLLSEYNNLSDAAYLRAKEDYLMGINFSRVLTLKYGNAIRDFLKAEKRSSVSVGRVMTCVLGMVVRREREIRAFVKTPFYRVVAGIGDGSHEIIEGEFKAVEGSRYFESPKLYKENGFKELETARELIAALLHYEPDYRDVTENGKTSHEAVLRGLTGQTGHQGAAEQAGLPGTAEQGAGSFEGREDNELIKAVIDSVERKKETKNPPLLFNLAELQNECSKLFKISPDETLNIVQELYEKKLVTYPRTDARVLSTAVAKEIHKNIEGLSKIGNFHEYAEEILSKGSYKGIEKTRYVNDKQITDHYAIIPTGQGFQNLKSLKGVSGKVYEVICRRFLSIFYPPAVYKKIAIVFKIENESFFTNFKYLVEEGYLKVAKGYRKPADAANEPATASAKDKASEGEDKQGEEENTELSAADAEYIDSLKKGMILDVRAFAVKEGETAPPKRYNSGSLILAMENAGQLIEDEELRAQIKGSGIGTSATRAEILNKLVRIEYLNLNKKTQIITPTLQGEMVADVVAASIKSLLNPELTASWEKGLNYVAEGTITEKEYMDKLSGFVTRMTGGVKGLSNQSDLNRCFNEAAKFYKR